MIQRLKDKGFVVPFNTRQKNTYDLSSYNKKPRADIETIRKHVQKVKEMRAKSYVDPRDEFEWKYQKGW